MRRTTKKTGLRNRASQNRLQRGRTQGSENHSPIQSPEEESLSVARDGDVQNGAAVAMVRPAVDDNDYTLLPPRERKEASLTFQIIGLSEQGRREEQQDRYLIRTLRNGGSVVAVADGHLAGGGIAADIAMRFVEEALSEYETSLEIERGGSLTVLLHETFMAIHRRIKHERTQSQAEMGTTLTVLVLTPTGQGAVLHRGDSEATQMCNRRIRRITRLHTLPALRTERGEWPQPGWLPWNLLARWIGHRNQDHIITQSLGVGNGVPDVIAFPIRHGDRFVVSSDGFHKSLSRRTLAAGLSRVAPLDQALAPLFTKALAASSDNVTAVAVECFSPDQ